jgi:hypothetical protein
MGYSLAQGRRETMRIIRTLWPWRGPLVSMIAIAIILGGVLGGCYYGPGPYRGWCYYHPYRC